jgi:hypothetical protein
VELYLSVGTLSRVPDALNAVTAQAATIKGTLRSENLGEKVEGFPLF